MMNRSGAILAARTRASASERATTVKCPGANFFSAELIATASASYPSRRRTLPCGVVPAKDGSEAGTSATTRKHENRKNRAPCQRKGGASCLWDSLFVAQCLDRIERGGPVGRIEAEPDTDRRANDQPGKCPPEGKNQVNL